MNFAEQSWTRIRDALAADRKVVAILPCGATEAHGPHLPLNTDVIISDGMAKRAAAKLEALGCVALVLPPLAYAPAEYASAFPGTITIGVDTARRVVFDIAASLKSQGVHCLAIANSHFDPANVAMLRDSAREAEALGLAIAFPDFARRALAQTLTEEFISGACHAGQFETSLVLAERPDLVDAEAARALPDNPASLTAAMARGAKTFHDAGGPDAYFGAPAHASVSEGERTYALMADALVAAVLASLQQ